MLLVFQRQVLVHRRSGHSLSPGDEVGGSGGEVGSTCGAVRG